MAQIINEHKVIDFCMREGIIHGPDSYGAPKNGHHGHDMEFIDDLTNALVEYQENPNVSNYYKIENIMIKRNLEPAHYVFLIMDEFELSQPKEDKQYDEKDDKFIFPENEFEQVCDMKSTLNETKEKKTKTTFQQLIGVASAMADLYVITSTGSIGHDIAMGVFAATGIAVGSTAVLSANLLKNVGKGVLKTGKVAFKAIKGTAQIANDKAEKIKVKKSIKQAQKRKKCK